MKPLRACVGLFLLAWASLAVASTGTPAGPTVGAIRWDGWFPGSKWSKNLEPVEFHDRLPFYTTWENGKPVVNSDDQGIMDSEIVLAARAGLTYWAFVYYHPAADKAGLGQYNYGLRRYLASEQRGKLNFCLNLQGQHLGRRENWPETVSALVDIFRRPGYQKVLGDRPLVYLFYVERFQEKFGTIQEAREAISHLRQQTKAAGVGNPYIVVQTFAADHAADIIDKLGLDASGAYCVSSDPGHRERRLYPFHELAELNSNYWERCRETGKQVVPNVTVGWDVRPRWKDEDLMKQYQGGEKPHYSPPSPAELEQYLRKAIGWSTANAEAAPAQTILVYAWNENDEGGWLVPTLAEGNARLEAIGSVLE